VARVFLSHATEDRRVAGEVHGWLSTDGHEVFLDQDLRDGITVGEQWQDRLYERLRWADAVLCLITAAYVRSVWCAAEVGIAQSRGARLLPLLAEQGVMHPLLGSTQYADYATDHRSSGPARSPDPAWIATSGPATSRDAPTWTPAPTNPDPGRQ